MLEIEENQNSKLELLESQLDRSKKEIEIIQKISNEVNATLDLRRIAETMLRLMFEIFSFEHSMILLLEEDNDTLKVLATHGYKDDGIGAEVKVGIGVIGMVAKKKKLMRMANLGMQRQYMQAIKVQAENQGMKLGQESVELPGLKDGESQVAIPMLLENELVGVFSVESKKVNIFDKSDEYLIGILANLAASAMQNARLYQREQERIKELENAQLELSNLNLSLESKVAERTIELKNANTQILDSIQYGSKIQRGILPSKQMIIDNIGKFEEVWYPRDVVGGDFYWFQQVGSKSVILLADCTGHGVPGAFMSLISISLLDRIFSESFPPTPADLLEELSLLIRKSLGQEDENSMSDDGLDAGVCYYDKSVDNLTFSGAKSSVFVQIDSNFEEIKGDLKSVGYRPLKKEKKFTNKIIKKAKGKKFIMISDGITDQIGEFTKRPYGKKRFVSCLNNNIDLDLDGLKDSVFSELLKFQGNAIRRDDITYLSFQPS